MNSRSGQVFALALTLSLTALFTFAQNLPRKDSSQKPSQEPQLKPALMEPGPLGSAGYITLAPIDDRPAVGQFAQMIGAIADHRVRTPPREMLGRFTTPGDTARIGDWLRAQDYSKTDAVVVSVDMLAYGGLVASRVHNTSFDEAKRRLEFFRWFRSKYPRIPVYAFSTIMRVAPTATAETRNYHGKLARWAELKDRVLKTTDQKLAAELDQINRELDPQVVENYLAARRRNLQINLAMLELVKAGVVNEMVLLQDDAREFGLHRQDQAVLKDKLKRLGIELRVLIYNGADEGSNSLVSRAILDKFAYKLRVAVVYSSEKSREVIAPFEDHPLEYTVESQIRAAGGIPVSEYDKSDYTLFVNAPGTSDEEFDLFLKKLIKELKETRHIALADLLFPKPHHSGADERLIAALKRENLLDRFAGYAAWNTAGNTLGTTIPHANMRVFYRTKLNDSVERAARAEAAHLEFLLHRYAGDYLYHDVVRLEINRRLREESNDGTITYQLTPEKYEQVNREVEQKLKSEIEKFFAENFQGRSYTLAYYNNVKRAITLKGLRDVKIHLPWPRTFEVVIECKLDYAIN
ncbi:MAG: DUF4127 family protein [Acidobacteria bacterium]|nr:DUF4127 family protein [Acidobacteriota bacterium]